MMLIDLFPETNLVECTFSWRTANTAGSGWDEYDHVDPIRMKRYVYRLPEYLVGHVKIGDTVVVHCQTGYQVCEIVTINAISNFDQKSIAPVVGKVDMSSYIDEVEKKKALAAMKKQIDAEKKRLESMVTYELIAEKNPEFKAMLEAFKEMGGEF